MSGDKEPSVGNATATDAKPTSVDSSAARKDYRHVGVTEDRPVRMSEVGRGFEQHSLLERRVLYTLVVLLSSLLIWLESSRLILALEATRLAVGSNVSAQYEIIQKALSSLETEFMILLTGMSLVVVVVVAYLMSGTKIYLVDFSVLHPDEKYMVSKDFFMRVTRRTKFFSKESEDFQEKILQRSGLGDKTYFPNCLFEDPPVLTMEAARMEAEYVMGTCFEDLLAKTGTKPEDIDFLIVNCSLFNPTPSLSAMIINKYKLRENIRNYNLAGMGCSAGVVSVDLAKDLLRAHPNKIAVIISTENITQNWYRSNERDMIVSNCLFRLGGAAILMSNKAKDSWRAKYQLLHTVRVHKGRSDEAYQSVFQKEDSTGAVGVRLSKELIKVVSDALKTNLTMLGPLILPISEQIKFVINFVQRKILRRKGVKPYTPNFKKAVEHYCIHAGGRAVIDGLEQNLELEPKHVLPSRATLNRVGNTSSSSIWYELSFSETYQLIRRGDRVWQIAFGSGFKCNSAIWKALRNVRDNSRKSFWDNVDGLSPEYQSVLDRIRQRL